MKDVVERDGEAYLSARGVLRMVELTDPSEIIAGPQRDWIIDFQRRRPSMTEAEATREVLWRIDFAEFDEKQLRIAVSTKGGDA